MKRDLTKVGSHAISLHTVELSGIAPNVWITLVAGKQIALVFDDIGVRLTVLLTIQQLTETAKAIGEYLEMQTQNNSSVHVVPSELID